MLCFVFLDAYLWCLKIERVPCRALRLVWEEGLIGVFDMMIGEFRDGVGEKCWCHSPPIPTLSCNVYDTSLSSSFGKSSSFRSFPTDKFIVLIDVLLSRYHMCVSVFFSAYLFNLRSVIFRALNVFARRTI